MAKRHLFSIREAQEMGFQIMLCANTALRGAIKGAVEAIKLLHQEESQKDINELICSWEQRQQLFKLKEIQQLEVQYSGK